MAYCGENVLWKTISKLGLSVATDVIGACLLSGCVWILFPGGLRTFEVSIQAWRIKQTMPVGCLLEQAPDMCSGSCQVPLEVVGKALTV